MRTGNAANLTALRIVCADSERLLRQLNTLDINIFEVNRVDALTVTAYVAKKDLKSLFALAESFGAQVSVIKRPEHLDLVRLFAQRPVLSVLVIFVLIVSIVAPMRILFIRIEGNLQIPDSMIAEQAALCGIRFGASRNTVRSEKVKNRLLSAMPQLQWVGVNTYGCVAEISVSEKPVADSEESEEDSPASMIADRDGIVVSCAASKGTLMCYVGQAVKADQLLISAYTDCGRALLLTKAEGEILAQTKRFLHAVSPLPQGVRPVPGTEKTKYSLLIGKKLINFYKDSGILDASCDKMYEQIYVTLPGGFRLPLAIVRETCVTYTAERQTITVEDFSWLDKHARSYLERQMNAGRIIDCQVVTQVTDGVRALVGRYSCVENICKYRSEEIFKQDG